MLAVYVCLIFLIEIGLLVLLCNQDIETTTSINRICKEFEKELSNSLLYGNVSCDTKSFILSKNKILSIKTDYWTNKYNLSEPIKIHINHNNDKFTIFVSYCGFKSNTYIINNALNFPDMQNPIINDYIEFCPNAEYAKDLKAKYLKVNNLPDDYPVSVIKRTKEVIG